MASFTEKNPMERPLIADSIVDVIGATPCVRLGRVGKEHGVVANIILKLESMEPCSSVKDRIAKSMIEEAEARGDISPDKTILIEPTSGNTGIGLAMVGAAKGYECILVMPDSLSLERRVVIRALGAKLVLTPAAKGAKGAVDKATYMVNCLGADPSGKKYFMLQQFENPDNPKVHRETTGPELWHQTQGKIDFLVGGVGTGGTLTGCTQFLRTKNPDLKTIAVEPIESAVLSGNPPGPHKIQGIGAGFIPKNCDMTLLAEILKIPSDTAIAISRQVAAKEGIFVGISSGASLAGAIEIGKRPENAGKNIVAILPDFGERYLSTALFADLFAEVKDQVAEPIN